MSKALIVIDMQKGSFTERTPIFDAEGVLARINTLSSAFRKRRFPVLFIQHDGTGTGEFEKGSWDWELLDGLEIEPIDILVDKYANDVFYNFALRDRLYKLEIA